MSLNYGLLVLSTLLVLLPTIKGSELTFMLDANDEMCFYEDVKIGEETILEFQVAKSQRQSELPSAGVGYYIYLYYYLLCYYELVCKFTLVIIKFIYNINLKLKILI